MTNEIGEKLQQDIVQLEDFLIKTWLPEEVSRMMHRELFKLYVVYYQHLQEKSNEQP